MKRKIYLKEDIEEAVKNSFSWANVCRLLGAKPATGSQSNIKKRAIKLEIDFSHFTGQGHNKGKSWVRKKAIDYCYLGSETGSGKIRKALIRDGLKSEECEICHIKEWNGQKVPLELDHINSNHYDNRIENLQIICPNCHALETVNRRKKKPVIKKEKHIKVKIIKQRKRKVKNRPSLEILLLEVKELGYSATGRKYKVSDNCIRKWIRNAPVMESIHVDLKNPCPNGIEVSSPPGVHIEDATHGV